MQEYSAHPAQMQYNGGAVVSTFVGDSFNWAPVKAGTSHAIFAIPNLQDPIEATHENTAFDGAFSWLAWPTDGGNSIIPGPMTIIWDDRFVTDRAGKPYMARKSTSFLTTYHKTTSTNILIAVSPWFSTHFNSKNWVFICESLITDRWIEMLALKPQLIEIITWNGEFKCPLLQPKLIGHIDYGESHYIGPSEPNHTDDGSSQWAAGFPHDGWRIIMKAYIAAYKAGASAPTVTQD
jgi:glucan endo-1,3-alpha-glucosidase